MYSFDVGEYEFKKLINNLLSSFKNKNVINKLSTDVNISEKESAKYIGAENIYAMFKAVRLNRTFIMPVLQLNFKEIQDLNGFKKKLEIYLEYLTKRHKEFKGYALQIGTFTCDLSEYITKAKVKKDTDTALRGGNIPCKQLYRLVCFLDKDMKKNKKFFKSLLTPLTELKIPVSISTELKLYSNTTKIADSNFISNRKEFANLKLKTEKILKFYRKDLEMGKCSQKLKLLIKFEKALPNFCICKEIKSFVSKIQRSFNLLKSSASAIEEVNTFINVLEYNTLNFSASELARKQQLAKHKDTIDKMYMLCYVVRPALAMLNEYVQKAYNELVRKLDKHKTFNKNNKQMKEVVNLLADCYTNGIGTKRNVKLAVDLLKKLANIDNSADSDNLANVDNIEALYELAKLYRTQGSCDSEEKSNTMALNLYNRVISIYIKKNNRKQNDKGIAPLSKNDEIYKYKVIVANAAYSACIINLHGRSKRGRNTLNKQEKIIS